MTQQNTDLKKLKSRSLCFVPVSDAGGAQRVLNSQWFSPTGCSQLGKPSCSPPEPLTHGAVEWDQ